MQQNLVIDISNIHGKNAKNLSYGTELWLSSITLSTIFYFPDKELLSGSVCLFLCLSVCLSVCLLATFLKSLWMDCNEISCRGPGQGSQGLGKGRLNYPAQNRFRHLFAQNCPKPICEHILVQNSPKRIFGHPFVQNCPKRLLGYLFVPNWPKPIFDHLFVPNYPQPIFDHLFIQNFPDLISIQVSIWHIGTQLVISDSFGWVWAILNRLVQ